MMFSRRKQTVGSGHTLRGGDNLHRRSERPSNKRFEGEGIWGIIAWKVAERKRVLGGYNLKDGGDPRSQG